MVRRVSHHYPYYCIQQGQHRHQHQPSTAEPELVPITRRLIDGPPPQTSPVLRTTEDVSNHPVADLPDSQIWSLAVAWNIFIPPSEQAQVQFHVLSPSLVSKQLLVSGDISFRYCGCTLTGVAQGQRIRAFQPHLFLHLRSTTTCFLSAKAPSSMTQLQLPLIPTNYCTSYPPPPITHDRRALAARDETQSRSTGQWSLTGHWPGQPFVLRRVLK